MHKSGAEMRGIMRSYNQLDEKQTLLNYKYGYQAFFITMAEMMIAVAVYGCVEPRDAIYKWVQSIDVTTLLFVMAAIPFAYYSIRAMLDNCVQKNNNYLLYIYAPIFSIIVLGNKKIFFIPFLILLWILFFLNLYTSIRNKRLEK